MDLSKSKPAPDDRIEDHTNRSTGAAVLNTIISALRFNVDQAKDGATALYNQVMDPPIRAEYTDPWTGKPAIMPDPTKRLYTDKQLLDMYMKDALETEWAMDDEGNITRKINKTEARQRAKVRLNLERKQKPR